MSQQYQTIIASATVQSVTGSGPSYTVNYLTDVTSAKIGDKVIVEKRAAGAGTGSTILSTYTYIVTALSSDPLVYELTIKYESDTAGDGDDSPADLYSGGGSSGSPEIAPHKIVRLIAGNFVAFLD